MKFINREKELNQLEEYFKLSQKQLMVVAVSGLRRVGKTKLVTEPEIVKLLKKLDQSHELIFYGTKIVRNELRDTPKDRRIENRKLTLHNLDVVVSHDRKSMLGEKSIKAYKKVNAQFQLRNPNFKTYAKFKRQLQNWRLS